jgi:hypothetical protein
MKDQAMKDQAMKDQTMKDQAMKDQTMKDQAQSNVETLDNVEVTIDDADISETISLKQFEEEDGEGMPDITNLLNMFMGNGQESASNPFAEIMQKMMTPNENGANPFAEIIQKMMTPDSSQ